MNKKKIRKCQKQGIKNLLFLYHIQAICGNIANKNLNAADDDEQAFNYRWPNTLKKENDLLIASAKSQSVRRASYQPAFMNGRLTISHTCLPCLPSERTLLFCNDLSVLAKEVS